MGVGKSNDCATVVVAMDQNPVVAGSQLTGNVYVDVRKPMTVNSLQLIISGGENTCVHYTTTSSSGKQGAKPQQRR
jgi:hypothetical protein